MLTDLAQRLKDARWPDAVNAKGWERGIPQDYLKKLSHYWQHNFDWRKQEVWLNSFDQFTAQIDDQTIHFFHIKSPHADALPLLMMHGWPSSNIEFLKMVQPLTNPKSGQAFHLVLPTTPGFGLSSPVKGDWHAVRVAKAYSSLMAKLGYAKYGVQASDIGADIADELNHIDKNLIGVHAATDMGAIVWYAKFTGVDPAENPKLSAAQKELVKELSQTSQEGGAYLEIQRTRPLTIGYLLNDSPLGQLGWIAEKFKEWTNDSKKLPEDAVDLDQMLTNVSLYWFTKSGASSAQFIYNNLHLQRDWGAQSFAPMGMAVFGAKNFARTLMDPQNQLPHWSEFKQGGHFPAMEEPELLAADIQKFFVTLTKVK